MYDYVHRQHIVRFHSYLSIPGQPRILFSENLSILCGNPWLDKFLVYVIIHIQEKDNTVFKTRVLFRELNIKISEVYPL